jgi:hypothetical protein
MLQIVLFGKLLTRKGAWAFGSMMFQLGDAKVVEY